MSINSRSKLLIESQAEVLPAKTGAPHLHDEGVLDGSGQRTAHSHRVVERKVPADDRSRSSSDKVDQCRRGKSASKAGKTKMLRARSKEVASRKILSIFGDGYTSSSALKERSASRTFWKGD